MLTRRENLLIRPWQERRYIHHRKKVLSALPAIDVAPPPCREHVSCKLKKLQKEAERCARIVEDNFTLLQHLNTINATSRVDNNWVEPPPNFLHRVGIYPIRSRTSKDITTMSDDFGKPSTRKERCFGCSPQRIPQKETIPEKRIPWEPPKQKLTRRGSSQEGSGKKYSSRCDEDLPQFRGKVWPKPGETKRSSERRKKYFDLNQESQTLVLSKGGLSVSVSFPQSTEILLTGNQEKVIQREFCECKSFPKIKAKKNRIV